MNETPTVKEGVFCNFSCISLSIASNFFLNCKILQTLFFKVEHEKTPQLRGVQWQPLIPRVGNIEFSTG